MTNEIFVNKIYKPFNDAFKLLKLIQDADQTSESDKQWQLYIKEIDSFKAKYPDNKLVDELITLLLNAGDIIAKENRKT